MSNAGVLAAIASLLQRFESGEVSVFELDDGMKDYVDALEGLRGPDLLAFRDLTKRLIHASLADEEYPGEDPRVVTEELKAWFKGVPK